TAPGRGHDRTANISHVIGSPSDGLLFGGPGDNVLEGREGNDFLDGRAGNDTLLGGPGSDTLFGGPGNDVLNGGDGNDKENGEDGDDRFDQEFLKNGAETLSGGPGNDTVDYSRRTEPVAMSKNGVGDDGEAGEGDNIAADIETVLSPGTVGTGPADYLLVGGDGTVFPYGQAVAVGSPAAVGKPIVGVT